MLVSGNGQDHDRNPPAISVPLVNRWAADLKDAFGATIHCATAGSNNMRIAADHCNNQDVDAIKWIWEPNHAEFPRDAFNRGDKNTVMRITRNLFAPIRDRCHDRGFEFWAKPSGRSTPDRQGSRAGFDYGEMAQITDGLNVQTQDSCQQGMSNWRTAVDFLVDEYQRVRVDGDKGLFTQITVRPDLTNGTTGRNGFTCAQYAWNTYHRNVLNRVTLWWGTSKDEEMLDFLQRRDALF